jgi:hypothetical protein
MSDDRDQGRDEHSYERSYDYSDRGCSAGFRAAVLDR